MEYLYEYIAFSASFGNVIASGERVLYHGNVLAVVYRAIGLKVT